MQFVQVAVALPVRGHFTYRVPSLLLGQVGVGHAVLVPFGPRKVTGYVVADAGTPDLKRIKPLDRLLDPRPAFDATQLRFFHWVARYYQAGLGEVIATALPSAMKAGTRTVHLATDQGVEALAQGAVQDAPAEVLRELVARPGLTRRGVQRRLRDLLEPKESKRALDALLRKGWAEAEQKQTGGTVAMEATLVLEIDPAELSAHLPRAGARQRAVVQAIAAAGGVMTKAQLVADQGPYARTAVKALSEAKVVTEELRERRDAVVQGELPERRAPPTLTPAQQAAVAAILGPPRAHLLHGVTGAGKTEVYLRAAAQVLERGQQVLVLVPEIGLTPLLTGRFRARFGDQVAVLHSGLTPAQRVTEWRRIRAGAANVAVGARSALFAPFQDLGLLVVDEEHDDSYKQDDGVRYNARDLAIVRGHQAGCPVVLGSATPALESWHNARTGRYGLIQLLERPTPRPVPAIELVDLNQEPKGEDGRAPLVAAPIQDAMTRALADGSQVIVLYNRRGYATMVECQDCGASFDCPSCGVSLVLHQSQRTLTCHYCGFHREMPRECTLCGGVLDELGKGTERIEQALAELFPDVALDRMDADTTGARGAHHRILERFRTGQTQLLVGTQIVAKGHDFPNVSLAVILGVDHVMRMPDFRAAERAFALITQLAGRAGRGDRPGRVLLQTRQPEHYVFQHLGDFDAFARQEVRQRELLRYPPMARLALVRVEGALRGPTDDAAWALQRRLRATADGETIEVLGPAKAALPRLMGRWRLQLMLRGSDPRAFSSWLRDSDLSPPGKGVRVVLDVDPRSLL